MLASCETSASFLLRPGGGGMEELCPGEDRAPGGRGCVNQVSCLGRACPWGTGQEGQGCTDGTQLRARRGQGWRMGALQDTQLTEDSELWKRLRGSRSPCSSSSQGATATQHSFLRSGGGVGPHVPSVGFMKPCNWLSLFLSAYVTRWSLQTGYYRGQRGPVSYGSKGQEVQDRGGEL